MTTFDWLLFLGMLALDVVVIAVLEKYGRQWEQPRPHDVAHPRTEGDEQARALRTGMMAGAH